jgi:hypothetical protein
MLGDPAEAAKARRLYKLKFGAQRKRREGRILGTRRDSAALHLD